MEYKEITIKKSQIKTATDEVRFHLKTKSLTSLQAIEYYGVTRLSAIIFCLRNEGYYIVTIPFEVTTRYGRKVNMAKYKYIKPSKVD